MKKIYWLSLGVIFVCVVLEIVFACLNYNLASLIISGVMLVFVFVAVSLYFCFVKHKCPKCKTVFKGKFLEIFFAPHTPTKRKMRCPMCGTREWCEDYFEKEKTKEKEDVK